MNNEEAATIITGMNGRLKALLPTALLAFSFLDVCESQTTPHPMAITAVLQTTAPQPAATAAMRSQTTAPQPAATTGIVLGVGTPNISATRSGTSIGIVAGGVLYLFDAGAGVERRLMEAGPKLAALRVGKLGPLFLTHLDPDHTLGLAGLLYYNDFNAPGQLGMGRALTVYGPGPVSGPPMSDRPGIGIRAVMEHLQAAFAQQPWAPGMVGNNLAFNSTVHATEIQPGIVHRDSNVTVTAFKVAHKAAVAFGYRVQTADRVIVISGDTSPVDAVVEACNGCDLLFHEVYGLDFGSQGPQGNGQGHTSAIELGQLAARARPKHLVVYHDVRVTPEDGAAAIRKAFSGRITFARDLDVF